MTRSPDCGQSDAPVGMPQPAERVEVELAADGSGVARATIFLVRPDCRSDHRAGVPCSSVAEVADPGHEHRRAGVLRRGDHVGVAHRAAGLDERGDAGREADVDAVGERVERVRRARAPRAARPRRRSRGPSRRPGGRRRRGSSGLSRARSARRSRTRTIAFDVTPRTRRQASSRSRRSASVGWRVVATCHVAGSSGAVSGAVTRTAPPAVRIAAERVRARGGGAVADRASVDDEAEVRLRGQDLAGRRAEAGRDDDLEEDARRGRRRSRRSTSRVSATTPPNAETGSPASAASHASRERRALRGAARVRVLDDHAARARRAPRASAAAADASRTLL